MTPDAWLMAAGAFVGALFGGYAAPTLGAYVRGFVFGVKTTGAVHRQRRGPSVE